MSKIWEKNYQLNEVVEKFTVGEDFKLDYNLIISDCFASIAHAEMLNKINILTDREFISLKQELINIINLKLQDNFDITVSDEDGHTAIENHLISKIGDSGKKIHTGRSRNDQVITALRLYSKDFLLTFKRAALELASEIFSFADKNKSIPMPGRTHMQIAMPSSIGLWAAAFGEELMDDLKLIDTAYEICNTCPLGSAASYGVPIPLKREMVSDSLGFKKVQNNVLYVNNSRGKIESIILDAMEQVVLTLGKMAQDLMIYSMPEFGYFSLPMELCTGSSIMPQKKNPDGLELLRAKSSSVSAFAIQIKNIIRSLPSGYNRDFQETKGPFIRGINTALGCILIATQSINKLQVNKDNLIKGFTPEIYATDAAIELVLDGVPFRDAYKDIGLNLDKLDSKDPVATINEKKYTGTTGNLGLNSSLDEIKRMKKELSIEKEKLETAIESLIGFKVNLFSQNY